MNLNIFCVNIFENLEFCCEPFGFFKLFWWCPFWFRCTNFFHLGRAPRMLAVLLCFSFFDLCRARARLRRARELGINRKMKSTAARRAARASIFLNFFPLYIILFFRLASAIYKFIFIFMCTVKQFRIFRVRRIAKPTTFHKKIKKSLKNYILIFFRTKIGNNPGYAIQDFPCSAYSLAILLIFLWKVIGFSIRRTRKIMNCIAGIIVNFCAEKDQNVIF